MATAWWVAMVDSSFLGIKITSQKDLGGSQQKEMMYASYLELILTYSIYVLKCHIHMQLLCVSLNVLMTIFLLLPLM